MAGQTVAAARPGASARPRLCLALLVALGFVLGCSEFIVIGIEPEIADGLGVPLARAGELVSYFALAYAVMTPVLALSTGRFRRFSLLVAYAVVFNLGNLVAMLAPGFTALLVSRIVLGSVSGGLLALGVTYIPELVSGKKVSIAISVVYAAFSVAMVLATSAGKMIADALDWHAALVAVFVLGVAVSLALVLVLPRTGATDEPATVREQFQLLRDPRSLAGIAIFLFGVGSVYVFYAYITPYLEDVLGMSPLAASGALMGYGAVCLVSNLLSGWVDARFGVKALVVSFLVQAGLLALLFAVSPAMPASLAVVFAIGLSMYIVSTPCVSMFMATARNAYPKALTLATSLEPMAFNMGIAFGTAVGGAVVSNLGMRYVGLVGAAFSLVACALAALTVLIVRRMKSRPKTPVA